MALSVSQNNRGDPRTMSGKALLQSDYLLMAVQRAADMR
jgi:hypothetical protein